MADYYLDIETYSKNKTKTDWKPDFHNDKIISIQYQQIDGRTGGTKSPLIILKAWESSEEAILRQFYPIFFNPQFNDKNGKWDGNKEYDGKKGKYDFVPIGYNLTGYDFLMLISRWNQIGIKVNIRDIFADHLYNDLFSIGFFCNRGKPMSLVKLAGKQSNNDNIPDWYDKSDYATIEAYIKNEAESFIKLYTHLVQQLPTLWVDYGREQGFIIGSKDSNG